MVASDGTGTFPVVGAARAGAVGVDVKAGSVSYITTGAPVPQGADAVIQVEDTEPMPDSGEVKINVAASAGQDIRTVGSDVQTVRLAPDNGLAGQHPRPGSPEPETLPPYRGKYAWKMGSS